jgi:hypothetical protein
MGGRDDKMGTLSIRDSGPYSARNSSKGALLGEAAAVLGALASGVPKADLRSLALSGKLLPQRSFSNRERIFDTLSHRYMSYATPWMLNAYKAAAVQGPRSAEYVSLLYLHYALRDHLTFDFVTAVLWKQKLDGKLPVQREALLALLDSASSVQPQIARWSESSRRKLAGSILTALRDFGALQGTQRKRLASPPLPLPTAEHLLRLLYVEGKRGREVLQDSAWRLFMLAEPDVVHVLSRLAQERRIGFERAGSTVVLLFPEDWSKNP